MDDENQAQGQRSSDDSVNVTYFVNTNRLCYVEGLPSGDTLVPRSAYLLLCREDLWLLHFRRNSKFLCLRRRRSEIEDTERCILDQRFTDILRGNLRFYLVKSKS